MKLSLKLPLFGMNMEQATIVKWHRRPGEDFKKNEGAAPAPCQPLAMRRESTSG